MSVKNVFKRYIMKKIVFVRHAKSSWEYEVNDIDRPLRKRGISDAGLVSIEFTNLGLVPEIVFSSTAKRALETCNIFMDNMSISFEKVGIHDQLYDFGGQKVISFIKSIDNNYNNIMIFGHNHALTSIVNAYGNKYIDNFPTSGLVVIEFDIEYWNDLQQGQTLQMIFPRDLKD